MDHWDLSSLDLEPHHPRVLQSAEEGRSIAIALPAGELLQEHEVHEHAWLVIVAGDVEVEDDAEHSVRAGAGALFAFPPHERHEVRATSDARLLLLLAPWPGEGRPPDWRS